MNRIGSTSLATDPETGHTEPHTVTNLIIGTGDKHLVDITLDTPGPDATLTATDGHPVWDETDRTWVDADQLTPTDQLTTPTGTLIPVAATRDYHRTQTVYNLTVDTLHTYYVLAGTTLVLVHNCGKNQGIYEFADQLNPGKTYVGKTKNFINRLQDHIDSGRLGSREDAVCTHGRNQ
ncbi:intein C-terminal splicing region [Parafrankia irregularis]|uniref:Intein C-terminal splicing region n=1 Tax=Parafrankia irregularis TaxID=795642 RepID=A0A0S4R010_9ACTN|nr:MULTISPECIES: polymorphic toxin-type HINT domain-containing protein [Parafrankia]MBE3205746.1 hypothetical protein [Parafrankia sp. CH37]CUU61243.1 intein C-terminal splicing region [Parafrankia irregularis]